MRRFATVLVSVIVVLTCSTPIVRAQFSEAGVEKFRAPVEAPDFTLPEIGGGRISLKELRGKVILLNFFASW